jgi:outer membrane cobalamin receptor
MLEEQICNLQTQNEIKEQKDNVEGTVKAKDQIIEKITKEKAQLQQEMTSYYIMLIQRKRSLKL